MNRTEMVPFSSPPSLFLLSFLPFFSLPFPFLPFSSLLFSLPFSFFLCLSPSLPPLPLPLCLYLRISLIHRLTKKLISSTIPISQFTTMMKASFQHTHTNFPDSLLSVIQVLLIRCSHAVMKLDEWRDWTQDIPLVGANCAGAARFQIQQLWQQLPDSVASRLWQRQWHP